MFKILVLICPMALDHAACSTDTATDVIRSMKVASAQQCGFMAQSMLAPTSLTPDADKQYMKVVCLRDPEQSVASAKP